ncbi:MAG: hypothetical protein IJO44_02780 [Clostridia bacterium]|nr:hypothetical protein [Clostridia bacterium]
MSNSNIKVIAIIATIVLVFTLITSNAVSVASVIFLAKGTTQTGTVANTNNDVNVNTNNGASNNTNTPANNGGNTAATQTPSGNTAATQAPAGNNNSGNTATTAPAGNGGNTATAGEWDKAKVFDFYKNAAHDLATTGKAGYNKIEWQVLENLQVGSVGKILQPVIDNFMTTKEEAEVQVQEKGSEDAKNRFPDCTLTDLSKVASATKKDLPNGNYEITIIMQDEDTPMNEESSFLAKVTSSVLFWEDIERTIKEDVAVVSAINSRSVNYKGYKITAEMTQDGKFVTLGHYATVDIKANAKIVVTLDIGGTLYNNCEYTDFKY